MRNIFIIIVLCLGALLPARAADAVAEARRLYEAKDYMGAIGLLQKELNEKGFSAELYYDLGNVYYKAGNYGAAILNYERALCLKPSMSLASNNLAVASNDVLRINESLTGDRNLDPSPATPTALQSLYGMIVSRGSNFWCVTSIVLFLLAVAAVICYLFFKGVALRKTGFFGGGILLLLSALSLLFSFMARGAVLSSRNAVVMAREIQLRANPSADAKETGAPLANGTLLQVVEERAGADGKPWVCVYLNGDYTGWIPASDIEKVNVPGLK